MITLSPRVLKEWSEIERRSAKPSILLLFRSTAGPDRALGAVKAAFSYAIEQLEQTLPRHPDGEDARTGHWSLAPASDGTVVLVDEDPDDFPALIDLAVRHLDEHGLEGSFEVYRPR